MTVDRDKKGCFKRPEPCNRGTLSKPRYKTLIPGGSKFAYAPPI